MQTKRTKDIIKALAYEYNMTEKEMSDIVRTPFDLVVDTMRNGSREEVNFPSVRIISFGTFYMSHGRKNFFKNLNSKLNGGEEELQSGADRPDNAGDKT